MLSSVSVIRSRGIPRTITASCCCHNCVVGSSGRTTINLRRTQFHGHRFKSTNRATPEKPGTGTATTTAAAASTNDSGSGTSSSGTPLALPMALASMAFAGYIYGDLSTRMELVERAQQDFQVQLSGKTNSAFVFVKPHACCHGTKPGAVEAVVETALKHAGIRITDQGDISADEMKTQHLMEVQYGAMAHKAVHGSPSDLIVPERGQHAFEHMFGETWDAAIQTGRVYNAKDAAIKLGLDAKGMQQAWSKLQRGTNLLKFGRGFYCGQVSSQYYDDKETIYVINGFYLSMRAEYCTPGAKIHWYTVSWPSEALSWSDFRTEIIGATDPAVAPTGSIRGILYDRYAKLGLPTKPTTGQNGVHASASPVDALLERSNWLGQTIPDDPFGKGLLAAGVPLDAILQWKTDPQVTVEGTTSEGKTISVFETLENLDADTSLETVSKISI